MDTKILKAPYTTVHYKDQAYAYKDQAYVHKDQTYAY